MYMKEIQYSSKKGERCEGGRSRVREKEVGGRERERERQYKLEKLITV